jgi:hypothetical protein
LEPIRWLQQNPCSSGASGFSAAVCGLTAGIGLLPFTGSRCRRCSTRGRQRFRSNRPPSGRSASAARTRYLSRPNSRSTSSRTSHRGTFVSGGLEQLSVFERDSGGARAATPDDVCAPALSMPSLEQRRGVPEELHEDEQCPAEQHDEDEPSGGEACGSSDQLLDRLRSSVVGHGLCSRCIGRCSSCSRRRWRCRTRTPAGSRPSPRGRVAGACECRERSHQSSRVGAPAYVVSRARADTRSRRIWQGSVRPPCARREVGLALPKTDPVLCGEHHRVRSPMGDATSTRARSSR